MSLTLRDAQYLCWKNFKKIDRRSSLKDGEAWTPYTLMKDLLKEVSDTAETVKKLGGNTSDQPKPNEGLATELSNILYFVFILAEYYGVNLEESFLQTMNDLILKFMT